jgi:ubiquinone/menaquinone biosynthesis C-methylase UbiE
MTHEKRNFDAEASAWDANPGRVKVAADIARAIREYVILSRDMDVLDFGCGTGLLTMALQPFVRSIHGVDSSRGMLDVLQKKVRKQGTANVTSRLIDLDEGDILTGCYDLVVSSMTLHHVKETGALLKQFYRVLRPAGILCIADLDPDDGRFHSGNTGVFHFGFNRKDLHLALTDAGFTRVRDREAARIEKPDEDGKNRVFTVFLMTGGKERQNPDDGDSC